MDHNGKALRWALSLLYLALCALVVGLLASYTRTEMETLYLTPILADDSGWEIYTLEHGARHPMTPKELLESAGVVYLSRIMDPDWEDAGYTDLRLDRWEWASSVFLDGELLYTTQPGPGGAIGRVAFADPVGEPHNFGEKARVGLPPGYGGRELTIAVQRISDSDYHGMPLILLTSMAVDTAQTVALANRLGMPAAAFSTGFLLLLGLFFHTVVQRRADWPLLLLALAAGTQSLYWLREYDLRFTIHFTLNVPLSLFFPHLFVLLPLVFLTVQMGRWKKTCALLVALGGGLALAAPLFSAWYSLLFHGLYLSLGAALVFGALEAKGGNEVFRLFFQALGLLGVAFALCCLLTPPGDGALAAYAAAAVSYALQGVPQLLLNWCSTALFLLCAFLSVAQTIRRTAEMRSEVALLSARNALTRENLRILQDSGAALAQSRHDMLGHLSVLQGLSREREYGRLDEYLARLTHQLGDIVPLRITGHPVVNAVLSQGAERAKQAGVEFSHHVELPDALPLPDDDLAAFLMNLLDNALTAAAQVPAGRRRWVEVTMHVRGKYLFIETQNSYAGPAERDGQTGLYRSRQGAGHGYGMKIMANLARRYQSELQAEAGDGVFLVRTALLMPQTA